MARNNNRGERRNSPPAPPVSTPIMAIPSADELPAPVTAPPVPAEDVSDLRGFEEGGGDVIPRKYVFLGMVVVMVLGGVFITPWAEVAIWMMGDGADYLIATGAMAVVIALIIKGYRGLAAALLVVGVLAYWYATTTPTENRRATPAPKPREIVARYDESGWEWSQPVDVVVPDSGATDWVRAPYGARKFHFHTDGGGYSVMFLGNGEGWHDVPDGEVSPFGRHTKVFRFRRYPRETSGRVVVKISYLMPTPRKK